MICLQDIESEIERIIARLNARSTPKAHELYAASLPNLNVEMARFHFKTGGKRLRAIVPCLLAEAYQAPLRQVLSFAVAVEFIHNATLVHDDLQDGDEVRREQPTIWKKYSPAQAINCGDTLLYLGMEALLDLPLEPGRVLEIQRKVIASVLEVIEGQSQEFLLKDKLLSGKGTFDDYLRVIDGKTAALLGLAVFGGIWCSGLERDVCDRFESAGRKLGLLFQMQDDLLDLYGEKGRDKAASDVYEGKVSALVMEYFESSASPSEKIKVLDFLFKARAETSDEMVRFILDAFNRVQVKEKVLKRIENLRSQISRDPALQLYPLGHQVLVSLAKEFLQPISHLLS